MKQVTIPAQWLQELIALCGPEDHELRVRVMKSAAPAPADALATGGQAHAVEQEPFGYFKAEPFGWPDCGPDDEGAVALYERPQAQADARDAGRWRMASLIHSEMMKHPDIRAEPEAASAYMKAVHDGVCFEAAIDSAIAAAKGE